MTGSLGRRAVILVVSAAGVMSVWTAPPANSQAFGHGMCGDTAGGDGQGQTGGTQNLICQGAGLIFVGPAVGQVAAVIGPTVIGPVSAGAVNVSAGDIAGNAASGTVQGP